MGGGKLVLNSIKNLFLLVLCTAICFCAASCAGGASGSGDGSATSLSIRIPSGGTRAGHYTAEDIASFTVTIKSNSYTATKTSPAGEVMTFSNIPVGNYDVTAYGKTSAGTIGAKGTAAVTIKEGETSTTVIHLSSLDFWEVNFYSITEASPSTPVLISSQNVSDGYTATRPAAPTVVGHTFSYWGASTSATSGFDFNTAIHADKDLYAVYDTATYTVALNYGGGADGDGNTSRSAVYAHGATVPTPTLTKTGYTFVGWGETSTAAPESCIITIPNATANKTYYAIWSAASYTITYSGVGTSFKGSLPTGAATTYTYSASGNFTLPTPTMNSGSTGYEFAGWYTDSNFTAASKVTQFAKSDAENKTFYARFWYTATSFTGTATEFAATDFKPLESDSYSYNVTITSGTISDIVSAVAAAGSCINLDLSSLSVTTIGANAFDAAAERLKGITLPSGITEIGCKAFFLCSKLRGTISIPATCKVGYRSIPRNSGTVSVSASGTWYLYREPGLIVSESSSAWHGTLTVGEIDTARDVNGYTESDLYFAVP